MISDYIPRGKENAITRDELCRVSGMRDRNVREAISQERRNVPIISVGKGYYIPDTAEDINRWIAQETHRAKSIFWSMRGAKEYLKEIENNG